MYKSDADRRWHEEAPERNFRYDLLNALKHPEVRDAIRGVIAEAMVELDDGKEH